MGQRRPSECIERVIEAHQLYTENPIEAYLEEFGVRPADVSIDRELGRIFDDALSYEPLPRETKVPLKFLLALILRKRSRGRPPRITLKERRQREMFFSNLKEKVREQKPGESAIDALWRVVEDGVKDYEREFGQKISEATLKRRLESRRRRRRRR
jgi:hypothetical protein